jgi:uncharacterized protein (DUF488 family)
LIHLMRIYSVGTSTRTFEEFMGILKAYEIEVAADVRSFPRSRLPHFHGSELARFLGEEGIDYCHLGKELGGYRRGGYEVYIDTPAYTNGLARLEELGRGGTTAFFCAERFPWLCHRRFIGASLSERGWEVNHIIEAGTVWQPTARSNGSQEGRDKGGFIG